MTDACAGQIADSLYEAKCRGTLHQPVKADGRLLGLDLAYAVQRLLVVRRQTHKPAKLAGLKVGLTSSTMQKFCGVNQPVVGYIFSDLVAQSPARIHAADFGRLGIESELAVRLAKPLDPAAATAKPAELLEYISAIAPAFELVDDRGADYNTLDAGSIVAENGWNGGLVLGPVVESLPAAALSKHIGTLRVNGTIVSQGVSTDVMGGPLHVLAWLGGFLPSIGASTQAGDWISTGSIINTQFAKVGDRFEFSLGDLGAAMTEVI